MSGAGLELTGHEESLAALAGIVSRLEHPKPMFANIGMSLVVSTQRRFEQGRGPGGSPWPPSIRALATGGKTMIESAQLMASQTFNASDAGVEVGTNKIYAAIHQLGGIINIPAHTGMVHFKTHKRTGKTLPGFRKAGKANVHRETTIPAHVVKMPARPFLGIDDDDEREVLAIAEEFVGGAEGKP